MSPHTPKKEQVLEKACFQKEPVPFLVMRRMPHQWNGAKRNWTVCGLIAIKKRRMPHQWDVAKRNRTVCGLIAIKKRRMPHQWDVAKRNRTVCGLIALERSKCRISEMKRSGIELYVDSLIRNKLLNLWNEFDIMRNKINENLQNI